MKRKGLIVSSIVMVIVLIASLTTATYAWFSSSAEASVDSMHIQTVASTGLQIGVFPDTMATPTSTADFKSGNVTAGGNSNGWYSADSQGFGQVVTILPDATGLYAASGNGQTMFAAYDRASINNLSQAPDDPLPSVENPVLDGNTPKYLGYAQPKNAVIVDMVVMNTLEISAGKKYLVIDELSLEAYAPSGKSGKEIAASARIALFAGTKILKTGSVYPSYSDRNAYNPVDNGVFLLEPYSNVDYVGGKYVGTAADVSTSYISAVTGISEQDGGNTYLSVANSKATRDGDLSAVTQWGGQTVNSTYSSQYDSIKNYPSKLIKVKDTVKDGKSLAAFSPIKYDGTTKLDSTVSKYVAGDANAQTLKGLRVNDKGQIYVSEYDADNNQVPVRLVVWFEGEDSMCLNKLATGGGLKLSIRFALTDTAFAGSIRA